MVHQRANADSDRERCPQSRTSRGFMAMKRMRPSGACGRARDSAAQSAGGASTAIDAAPSLAATKSTRCCSHSCEWPSTSGSKTRTSRAGTWREGSGRAGTSLTVPSSGALLGGDDGIEPVHQMAEDARLGIVRLDELAAAPAQFLAQAAVVGEADDGLGES